MILSCFRCTFIDIERMLRDKQTGFTNSEVPPSLDDQDNLFPLCSDKIFSCSPLPPSQLTAYYTGGCGYVFIVRERARP